MSIFLTKFIGLNQYRLTEKDLSELYKLVSSSKLNSTYFLSNFYLALPLNSMFDFSCRYLVKLDTLYSTKQSESCINLDVGYVFKGRSLHTRLADVDPKTQFYNIRFPVLASIYNFNKKLLLGGYEYTQNNI